MENYIVENAIAAGDTWGFANATANQRQGINVRRKDGQIEWYVRCEKDGEQPRYRLQHVYEADDKTPFNALRAER